MITNQINEISVWLDQLEDEGLDVSLLRLLCGYNYFSNSIVDSSGYNEQMDGDGHGTSYGQYVGYGEGAFNSGEGFEYGYGHSWFYEPDGDGCMAYWNH